MKKTILTAALLGALLSGSLYAEGNKSLPEEKSNKIARVAFENVHAGDRLYIKDADGKTLYSEKIKSDGTYSKRFDLSAFPEDQYRFEVDKKGGTTLLPFEVEGENVELKNDLRHDIAKPTLVTHKDQVILTRASEGTQNMKIDIYHKGRNVYTEEVSKTGGLARQYDFSTSVMGEYLFKITYDDRIFTKYVDIR